MSSYFLKFVSNLLGLDLLYPLLILLSIYNQLLYQQNNMPFVVIRLRQTLGSFEEKCIHLSATNTLTVENSKTHQQFTFDMIATETTSQLEIFNSTVDSFLSTIKKGLTTSLFRLDHLVMAYGQKGSGKSYTIFGQKKQEGILPQLIDRLNQDGYQLKLSAFQIYNQQIYDLLINFHERKIFANFQEKCFQIKQDLYRGVHIDGLEIIDVTKHLSPNSVVQAILNYKYSSETHSHDDRKSHKIMTLYIKHQRFHSAKQLRIHFVQLASCDGQREYYTKRPSISINKSLNNLNGILSSLMDTANGKPKKHIPFRDSKLTFYLKDMLSSNASHKWIFTSIFRQKNKLSESINSLMFTKRAKCLPESSNQIQGEKTIQKNIRLQVKEMRKELQNSRFIHGKSIQTEWQFLQETEKSQRSPLKLFNLSPYKPRQAIQNETPNVELLISTQNQLRGILKLYQQRIYYLETKQSKKQSFKGVYNDKKILENLNHKHASMLLNFPLFSEVVNQNSKLKQELSSIQNKLCRKSYESYKIKSIPVSTHTYQKAQKMQTDIHIYKSQLSQQQQIFLQYQKIINNLKEQIRHLVSQLRTTYENDMKRQSQDKLFGAIQNQNDCLKLTILTQQEEIDRLHREYSFISLQIKALSQQNRILTVKNIELQNIISKGALPEYQIKKLMTSLLQIKESIQKEQSEVDKLITTNQQLQNKIEEGLLTNRNKVSIDGKVINNKYVQINKNLKLQTENKNFKKQIKQLQEKKTLLQKQLSKLSSKVADLNRQLTLSKQTQLNLYQELTISNQKGKAIETKERVQTQKLKQLNLQMNKMKKELLTYSERSKQIKSEFNRSQMEIIQEYRGYITNKRLSLAKRGSCDLQIACTKSHKLLDCQKTLNTTIITSTQKLSLTETPRLSSERKIFTRQFERGKEKQRDLKPFFLKSKEIKNSIVQKI